MSHAIIDYVPTGGSPVTRLVVPAGDLNGSAAALNASIQALTDAIAMAQAVLATLNSLATDPNLSSDGSGNIVVAGSASLDDRTILLGGGLTGGTPGDGSANFLNGAMAVIPAPAGQGDSDTGQIVTGDGHSLALNFNSSYPQGFGNGFNCMFAAISVGSDGHFAVSNDTIANLLTGPGSYSYFLDASPDGVSFANGGIHLNSDGSASFASGNLTIDTSGLAVNGGTTNLDNGAITTDGSGDLTVNGTGGGVGNPSLNVLGNTTLGVVGAFTDMSAGNFVQILNGSIALQIQGGTTSLDGGAITTDGNGTFSIVQSSGTTATLLVDGTGGSPRHDLVVTGNHGTSLDGGLVQTDGIGTLIVGGLITTPTTAPLSPVAGQIYYDSGTNHFLGWNGSAWKQLDN